MLSHNKARYVEESVRSVMAQTYKSWELRFIDDGSMDGSVSLMLDLRDRMEKSVAEMVFVSQMVFEQGEKHNRNTALRGARGRWIAFLNVGDVWTPDKLEKQVAFMEENGYEFSYTEYGLMDSASKDRVTGAFSERSLGEPAIKHFVHEAIKKLWLCEWEWREDLTIENQLRLIIGSLMSEAERKYRQRGGRYSITLNENLKVGSEPDFSMSDFYEWMELVADGDEELERYVKAFKVSRTPSEIALEM